MEQSRWQCKTWYQHLQHTATEKSEEAGRQIESVTQDEARSVRSYTEDGEHTFPYVFPHSSLRAWVLGLAMLTALLRWSQHGTGSCDIMPPPGRLSQRDRHLEYEFINPAYQPYEMGNSSWYGTSLGVRQRVTATGFYLERSAAGTLLTPCDNQKCLLKWRKVSGVRRKQARQTPF